MDRRDQNIEELFRTLFQKFTVNPTPGLWKKVQARIAWKQFLSLSLNSFNIYYLAVLMALAGSGTYFLLNQRDRVESNLNGENPTPMESVLVAPAPESRITGEAPRENSRENLQVTTSSAGKKAAVSAAPAPDARHIEPADMDTPTQHTSVEEDKSVTKVPSATKTSLSGRVLSALQAIIRVRADFEASPMSGCSPMAVNFRNLSENAASVNWNFGDGGNSDESDPSYVFDEAGEFLVTLKIRGKDGLEYIRQQQVRVYETPMALFEFDEDVKPAANQPVYFYNYSRGADYYEWDFGDNHRSSQQEPVHFYQGPGNYHVKLKVWTDHQCHDSLVIYNAFTTREQPIEVPNAFTPNLNGPTGGYYDVHDINNTVFHPVIEGALQEFQLRVFNRSGMLLFESHEISIGWDGYYNEQLMKQDVYIWKLRGKFSNGKTFVESGDVTLIKQQ
jgi:gliding motility-associated-like protein